MGISFVTKKPKLQEKEITITENGTQTVTPDTGKDGLSSVAITTNVSGGSVEESDVNFYDYDGTLTNSYSKAEFLALTAMPENPSHTGLVAQGWNWDLADAKAYVQDYGELDIGQNYTTASGLSEFDIELTVPTGLTVTLNMNGTKNWGDGTTDTATSHTYSTVGKYTITCDGTTMTTTMYNGIFGQGSSNYNNYVKDIRITNVTTIPGNSFHYCNSLKSVTLSSNITTIEASVFYNCSSLTDIILPQNLSSLGNNTFRNSYSLKKIIVSQNLTSVGPYCFNNLPSLNKIIISKKITTLNPYVFQGSYLKNIIIPKTINSISNNAFSNCYILRVYDFSQFNSIPSIENVNVFNNINKTAKIIVPDSLYTSWIGTTNWTTYADYIVKESDYNA